MSSEDVALFGGLGQQIAALASASLFYGTFSVVFASSTYLLWRKHGLKSRTRSTVLIATTLMYCVATVHWSLLLAFTWILVTQSPDTSGPITLKSARLLANMDEVLVFLPIINFLVSDAIVVWRAWLICGRRPEIVLPCAILFVLALLAAVVSAVGSTLSVTVAPGMSLSLLAATLFGFLTMMINLLSTGLIAWKAWCAASAEHQKHLSTVDRPTQVEKILALLIESGVLYTGASLICSIILVARAGKLNSLIIPVVVQTSGIYPTLIVVLASLKKTHCDRNFTYDDTGPPQFAPHHGSAQQTTVTTHQNEYQSQIVELSVFEAVDRRASLESKKAELG
ncbi:hypothetical protein EVG20_g2913 [Dentipellis fragilis]|uniref:G-protein coupled receptors family 1 profile domain-containing protein n=1 Tax=Dentipellis fragilis TaxID=205917 RepID=A0A4Y9Z6B6_9AGAM|nr:hypothetical protein EVG20_g2913 [Dentipellis fragilis]